MTRQLRYSMLVQRSEEDACLFVTLPKWEGRIFNPVTHGGSYEEAVRNELIALGDLVALAQEDGGLLPAPQFLSAAA